MLCIRPWRQRACRCDHDDHGSTCGCHCHWYYIKHRLKLPNSIAFHWHLPTATNMHHAAYPAYDLMLLRDSPKMSKMVTACLGSIPTATSSITAASALTFFASHICTWQLWPDLTSADGLGMKRLNKQPNTSALRCGKTVAARHRDPGEHDSMCCCHWYCIKHRLKRCIVFAGFNCPQSSKSDSSK